MRGEYATEISDAFELRMEKTKYVMRTAGRQWRRRTPRLDGLPAGQGRRPGCHVDLELPAARPEQRSLLQPRER